MESCQVKGLHQLAAKWEAYLTPCGKGAQDPFFLYLPQTSAHLCADLWVLGACVSFSSLHMGTESDLTAGETDMVMHKVRHHDLM